MADQNITARFEADLSSLTAAVSEVNRIAAQTEKAFVKSNAGIEKSTKGVEDAFKRLGEVGKKQLDNIAASNRVQATFASLKSNGTSTFEAIQWSSRLAGESIEKTADTSVKATQSVIQPATNVKKAFQETGKAVRQVGVLVGGTFGDVVFYVGEAIGAAKSFGEAILRALGPIGIAATIALAAGSAVAYFANQADKAAAKSKLAKDNIAELNKQFDALSDKQDAQAASVVTLERTLKAYETAIASLKEQLQKANESGDIVGKAQIEERLQVFEKQIAPLKAALAQLEEQAYATEQAMLQSKLSIIDAKTSQALERLEKDYKSGGDQLDLLQGQVDEYRKAKEAALAIDNVTLNVLEKYQQKIDAATEALKRHKEVLSFEEQAKEDAKLPLGSSSPREPDAPGTPGVILPEQGPLPTVQEVSDLTKALEVAQQQIAVTAEVVGQTIGNIFQTLAHGIGDAVASAIVYGTSLADTLMAVLKQVLAQVISSLVQLGVQYIINSLIGKAATLANTVTQLASYAGLTYAGAFAATAAIPFVGPALAPGVAQAAVTAMLAGAAASGAAGAAAGAGFAAFAEGGVVTSPVLGLVGEAGPEAILPLSDLNRLVGGGEATFNIVVELDGAIVAEKTVKHMPSVIRRKVGSIF